MKKLLSIILCLSIILSICCYSVSATVDYSYKIDDALAEKLETMDDDDTIDVSIWVTDINYDELKAKTVENVKEKVSSDVLTLVKNDGDEDVAIAMLNKDRNKTLEKRKKESKQMQIAIEEKREIASKMQKENNKAILNELFPNKERQPKILYESKYAPNIELTLTKEQINEIIKSKKVDTIYCSSNNIELALIDTTESASSSSEVNDTYFTATGLTYTRNAQSLYGDGVNVGIFDGEFTDPSYLDYFENDNIVDVKIDSNNLKTSGSSHGDIVASIIGGMQYDENGDTKFLGAAPNVKMYWTAGFGYKPSFDYLIENNCNVVNMSLGYYTTGYENNPSEDPLRITYSDIDKWIDHVSTHHSVHVVGASGNDGKDTVLGGQKANNTIVVGNCYNNGDLYEGPDPSSYSSSDTLPYKPDLVAPGVNLLLPTGVSTGTSLSAPLVTSAVAQLCMGTSVLRQNPTLMKALVLAGTVRTPEMISTGCSSIANQVSTAFSHEYGCGMLNAYNLYASAINNYYTTGTLSSTDTVVNFTKRITGTGKHLRIVAIWDRVSEISGTDHTNGTVNNSTNDVFLLTVTAPDGTTYDTVYYYDTKALLSFDLPTNGTYTFKLTRVVNSGKNIDYSIAYSVMSET